MHRIGDELFLVFRIILFTRPVIHNHQLVARVNVRIVQDDDRVVDKLQRILGTDKLYKIPDPVRQLVRIMPVKNSLYLQYVTAPGNIGGDLSFS